LRRSPDPLAPLAFYGLGLPVGLVPFSPCCPLFLRQEELLDAISSIVEVVPFLGNDQATSEVLDRELSKFHCLLNFHDHGPIFLRHDAEVLQHSLVLINGITEELEIADDGGQANREVLDRLTGAEAQLLELTPPRLRLGLPDALAPEAHGLQGFPRRSGAVLGAQYAHKFGRHRTEQRRQCRTIILIVISTIFDHVPQVRRL
jgi:hypothetical protein